MSGLEIIGGVSAIIAITDASIKTYNSARKDLKLSEAFVTVGRQLPIVLDILRTCQRRLGPIQPPISEDVSTAIQTTVHSCQESAQRLRKIFESVIPGDNDTWRIQYIKILRRVGKGNTVEKLMLTIAEDVQLIFNHHAITSMEPEQLAKLDLILHELRSLRSSDPGLMNAYSTVVGSQANFQQNSSKQTNSAGKFTSDSQYLDSVVTQQHETVRYQAPVGICLNKAPFIAPELFVGRVSELDQMERYLRPSDAAPIHRRLVLGGNGGSGKTQLAITYVNRHRDEYGSAFWFNATTEATIKNSFQTVADHILGVPQAQSPPGHERNGVALVHQWLCNRANTQWLLIFDNYDDPDLFDLSEKYYPCASHGAIIVTTRRPNRVAGPEIRVKPLADIEESLKVLETRSQRHGTRDNSYAKILAKRLDGLPLALATAGAYLRTSSLSFKDYLRKYETTWSPDVNQHNQPELQEYQNRTLYTTWLLTYTHLTKECPDATRLLHLLAYFDNQHLWYGLFQAGLTADTPEWLQRVTESHVKFDETMRILTNYCLLDVQQSTGSWSMHNCVHDWMLGRLNQSFDAQHYGFAVDCVALSLPEDCSTMHHSSYSHLAAHAIHLVQDRFWQNPALDHVIVSRLEKFVDIADLLRRRNKFQLAEQTILHCLARGEKVFGSDHRVVHYATGLLGVLHLDAGSLDRAEQLLTRIVMRRERAYGPENESTLNALYYLGQLYHNQGRIVEAEQMLAQTITGRQRTLGPDHIDTLRATSYLATIYVGRGKHAEAEQMLSRILAISEKLLGPDHNLPLSIAAEMGGIYRAWGRFDDAEAMLVRARSGHEKMLGPDHPMTLLCIAQLALNYCDQGQLKEAAQIILQALSRNEEAVAPDNEVIRPLIDAIASIHLRQDKLQETESIFLAAIAKRKMVLRSGHPVYILLVEGLGMIYTMQDKFAEGQELMVRTLNENPEASETNHSSILSLVQILGICYSEQGQLEAAEQTFMRVLAAREAKLGPEHRDTLKSANCLGCIYRRQGKLQEAEQLLKQTLTREEKLLGPKNLDTLATLDELGLVFRDQGRLEDAENTLQRVVAMLGTATGSSQYFSKQVTANLDELRARIALQRAQKAKSDNTEVKTGDVSQSKPTPSKSGIPDTRKRHRLVQLLGLKSSKSR